MEDQYHELYTTFRWWVPQRFNIADACCRRWTTTSVEGRRIALYSEDETGNREVWTYARLEEYANRLSNGLRRMGVQRGDRIAVVLPQRPEALVAYLAVFQLGAIVMPLSPLLGPDALEYRLRDSEARIAIVDDSSVGPLQSVLDRCPMLRQIIGIGTDDDDSLPWRTLIARQEAAFEPVATLAHDPAILLYSPSPAGTCKGALLPHSVLIGHLPGFVASHNWFPQTGDVLWTPADWSCTGGLLNAVLPTLYFGHAVVGTRGHFSVERSFQLLERYQVTNLFLPPTSLKRMMKALPAPSGEFQLALRSIAAGGDAVEPEVFAWARDTLGVTVNEVFGQTESNYVIGNSHEKWPARAGSIGRPYPGHNVALLDDDGKPVAPGEVGEISVNRHDIHGYVDPVMFLGYWRDDEATRAKFLGAWSRTGDLARVDEDGYFWHCGRLDDMFKASGHRIAPGEVEQCLVQHPAVVQAAVVPTHDADGNVLVKAFVVRAVDLPIDDDGLAAELQALASTRLAPYEQPSEIEFVNELPMSPTGKVQRKTLMAREGAKAPSPLAPPVPSVLLP
jgi:acetyl-CoA synthetase